MINKKQIDDIEQIARGYFEGASVCHDWTHVKRVKNLALSIGEQEKANLEIVEIVALLHDIGRKEEFACKGKNSDGTKFCHAQEGAKEAKEILSDFEIDKKDIDNILHCIVTHRFRNEKVPKLSRQKFFLMRIN